MGDVRAKTARADRRLRAVCPSVSSGVTSSNPPFSSTGSPSSAPLATASQSSTLSQCPPARSAGENLRSVVSSERRALVHVVCYHRIRAVRRSVRHHPLLLDAASPLSASSQHPPAQSAGENFRFVTAQGAPKHHSRTACDAAPARPAPSDESPDASSSAKLQGLARARGPLPAH